MINCALFHFCFLTHCMPLVSVYTPWKHQKTRGFSDVFRGYRKRPVSLNGLIKIIYYMLSANMISRVFFRSSRSQIFFKKGVPTKFAIFAAKQLCWSLFFNKTAGLKLWDTDVFL